uniref:Uncharacterized protein n=1 Tax=Rhizophora mucronata TaxID=61149 RepID=A0A2P2KTU8_RHIMU
MFSLLSHFSFFCNSVEKLTSFMYNSN